MTLIVPPIKNHLELSPEEVNDVRSTIVEHLKKTGIDLGVTTALVLTVYDTEVSTSKHLEIRGTTNPELKRFKVPVMMKSGKVDVDLKRFVVRPPYDARKTRGEKDNNRGQSDL